MVKEVDGHCNKSLPEGAFDLSVEPVYQHVRISCSFADYSHHAILK